MVSQSEPERLSKHAQFKCSPRLWKKFARYAARQRKHPHELLREFVSDCADREDAAAQLDKALGPKNV